jgi:hypothetical protein
VNVKASELSGTEFFKGLIYGNSGDGKTCLAAQFPTPMEVWDFDGKFNSAIRYLREINKGESLTQIELHQFGQLPLKERIPAWEARLKSIDDLQAARKPLPFKTLVLDSITTLSHHLLEDYIYRSQLGIKRALPGINALQDYQLYDKHMTRILVGILALPCNVVVLGHLDSDKDESTGVITKKPLAAGQQLSKKLPVWFEEVYVSMVKPDGKRILMTKPQGGYIARTQRGLAAEVPMDVKELLK